MPRVPKITELSSREDFIIQSFPQMKKVNTLANKLFNLYYIDSDRNSELSPMMRTMMPSYFVDPTNPEHPGAYILAGSSQINYIERVAFIIPFVNSKGKLEYDLSGWKGLLINPEEFNTKVKPFRKSKLEPLIMIGDREGERVNQSLILRESDTSAKDELVLSFLQLPNRQRDGEEAYTVALNSLIYNVMYQYLPGYLSQDLKFNPIAKETIESLNEYDIAEFVTADGDRVTVAKNMFTNLKDDAWFKIAKVPHPEIDTSGGRFHYIVSQDLLNEHNVPYATIYTLIAALQLNDNLEFDD